MAALRGIGSRTRGIQQASDLTSPSGTAARETTLITIDDAAVLAQWENLGVTAHRLRGDGRVWFRVLPAAPVAPVMGDVWLEDDVSLGVVARVRTATGTTTLLSGDIDRLHVIATAALLQGHAVRSKSDGSYVYASATVDANRLYRITGIVQEDVGIGDEAAILTDGALMTLADWSLITGSAALIAGEYYWLSTTPGRYISTPAAAVASRVGLAVTTDTLEVRTGLVVVS